MASPGFNFCPRHAEERGYWIIELGHSDMDEAEFFIYWSYYELSFFNLLVFAQIFISK